MEFNELVSDFAGRYAIGDIFAKDGLAELVIDGTEITLREDAGGGNVVASAVIEGLVNTAEEWRRNATGFMDVDEEAATTEAEALDANPLSGDPGFLRV